MKHVDIPKQWHGVFCRVCEGTGREQAINPKWLRWKRERSGKSVRAMARHCGVSAPYLSDIERGNRRGNLDIIRAYGDLPCIK